MKRISILLIIVCLFSIAFIGCQKKSKDPSQAILGTWIGKTQEIGNMEFLKDSKLRLFDNFGNSDDTMQYEILPEGKLKFILGNQSNTFQYEIDKGNLKIITLPTADGKESQVLEYKKASEKEIAELNKQIEENKKTQETAMPKASDDIVVFETTMGTIKMELYPEAAPKTVNNFLSLVNDGFYNGIIFHRVIPDFMIQCGGVREDGSPKNVATQFEDEINPTALGLSETQIAQNEAKGYVYNYELPSIKLLYGVLAMANAGANTNGSQIFIITKKEGTDWLNGLHTGFGKVIEGMDVAEKIQAVKTIDPNNGNDQPVTNVVIKKAYVTKR